MFRIDRRYVNLSSMKTDNPDADNNIQVDVDGELVDAAAYAEAEATARVNEYLSEARNEAESKMNEILENARCEAANIIMNAHNELEEERKNAWQEGFEEGSIEGKRLYDEKTTEKMREDDESLGRLLDEIYNQQESTYKQLEDEVINLSLEIVRKIINPAEDELGNVYTSLIKNALRQMSSDGKLVIRVGPREYERFFASGAAVIELDSGVTVKASVLRDVSLTDGDLIIDTDDVTINAGIDSQLQYVKLAFERANQYEPD